MILDLMCLLILSYRVKHESLHKESISANLSSQPTFSLPQLPSDMFPSDEPVDVRVSQK